LYGENEQNLVEDDLRTRFIQAMMCFKKLRGALNSVSNLNISEAFILRTIEHDSMSSEQGNYTTLIQDRLHISKPAISQNITALEEKGLITRRVNQSDRRRFDFELTEKGLALAQETRVLADRRMKAVVSRMGEDDTKLLIQLLEKLSSVADDIIREDAMDVGAVFIADCGCQQNPVSCSPTDDLTDDLMGGVATEDLSRC
jgi:DNA-binding MarR family transcriptional regulator